ncbi:hypothetical protein FRC07_012846 [Ceratobasidium sp. 392]|nr:hypothetical protein FRC07_012846 [Ceratobasidium sp. 392]
MKLTKQQSSVGRKSREYELVFDFPNKLDLTRLKLYTPFVKTVRTTAPYVVNWPRKVLAVSPQTTKIDLLPNLRHVVINSFGPPGYGQVDWINLFLTPNLRGLEILSIYQEESSGADYRSDHSWLDRKLYQRLMHKISVECPELKTLRLFSNETSYSKEICVCLAPGARSKPRKLTKARRGGSTNEAPDSTQPAVSPYLTTCNTIPTLRALRHLSIGGANVGQQVFRALGQLPYLQSLSLHADQRQALPETEDPITLLDDSFASLQHLAICGANACQGYWPFKLTWSFINAFQQMRLKRISLGGIEFSHEVDATPGVNGKKVGMGSQNPHAPIGWADLLAALPGLEALNIQLQDLKPRELRMIASTLPSLCLLVLWSIELDEM